MEFETIKKDNRKKLVVVVIAILAIASVVFFVSTRANYKAEHRLNLINKTVNYSISDLNVVAIKVQNSSGGYDTRNTVPTSGYTLSSESYCEVNGNRDTSIQLEYKDGKVTIGVSTKGTKCYLFFDAQKTASQTLLAKNEMVNENGYRYEGANPNNYITFNNELWRIIGVFEVETTAGTREQLVKLIRNESIGNIRWDTYGRLGSNDWTQSDLKTILNGQYYNGVDINYTYRNPSNPYASSNPTVSITGKNINDTARNMIENVKWNIGGASTYGLTASAFYTVERGTTVYSGRPTIWNGYIGLMYPSDYGYAVDSASCVRTTTLNNYYDSSTCKTNNWLFNSGDQWTITPHSPHSDNVFSANYSGGGGYVSHNYAFYEYGVRPSIYLKSNVSIVDNGKDGSQSKPYDLVLN